MRLRAVVAKGADVDKAAKLCHDAADLLHRSAADNAPASDKLDSKTFMEMIEASLDTCSVACDGDDKPSCKELDHSVDALCGTLADTCKQLCDTVKSPSLKDRLCHPKK